MYQIVEAFEILEDGTKKNVKIQIQEVPNDESRHQEVIDHMTYYYLRDEPIEKAIAAKYGRYDPNFVEYIRCRWKVDLIQGLSIGAYILNSKGEIENLIGVNILSANEDNPQESRKAWLLRSRVTLQELDLKYKVMSRMMNQTDVRRRFFVDKYLISGGLSVHPKFRGQKLGLYLLEFRTNIGRKHGFRLTCGFFSSRSSQILAERAGFLELASVDYNTAFVNEDGTPVLPNIDSDCIKWMSKCI